MYFVTVYPPFHFLWFLIRKLLVPSRTFRKHSLRQNSQLLQMCIKLPGILWMPYSEMFYNSSSWNNSALNKRYTNIKVCLCFSIMLWNLIGCYKYSQTNNFILQFIIWLMTKQIDGGHPVTLFHSCKESHQGAITQILKDTHNTL